MAKHKTLWSPDTCECEVEYETDDEKTQDDPVVSKVIRRCKAHEGADAQVLATVLDENRRKNYTFAEVEGVLNLSTEEEKRELLNSYKWSFDADRKLHIEFVGTTTISAADKTAIQMAADSRFGTDKVIVH